MVVAINWPDLWSSYRWPHPKPFLLLAVQQTPVKEGWLAWLPSDVKYVNHQAKVTDILS